MVLMHTMIILLLLLIMTMIRLKGIEQDYSIHEINIKIQNESFDNRELKAKKAKNLSSDMLMKYAKQYSLKEAKEGQIIIIEDQ
jgi:cell division protein FtsL